MKIAVKTIVILGGIVAALPLAQAQSPQFNVFFGVGTATDSSSKQQIDTFQTGTPYTSPKLGGLFLDGGANMMVTSHWGVGADLSWRATQAAFAGLQYRPLFWDVDGIWQPAGRASKRVVPEIQAGLGGVHLGYYYNSQYCDQFVGCSTSNVYLEGANHFQVNMSAAVRFYPTTHFFVRPAVDVHWVNDFYQFGHNWVPEYTVGIGYTFGGE